LLENFYALFKEGFVIVRQFLYNDLFMLEQIGGFAHQYGRNIQRWINNEYITESDCYVFDTGETLLGGVCFCDDTDEEREILDFALTDIIPNGNELLTQAVYHAVKPKTRKISYNLYNDTEQYLDIKNLFQKAGFAVEQEKMRYIYENTDFISGNNKLHFKTVAEVGEDLFTDIVERVTVNTLDQLMATDAARLGSSRAAREYVNGLKTIDYNTDWWRLGYIDDLLIGLIIPQRLSEETGAINYIGVLPEYRGHGYGLALLLEGTRILTESGVKKIYADIDIANKPLSSALEKLGYVFKMEEVVLVYHVPE
jgi:ribosomal protein S18 acetylase RimI-like enzyme